MGLNERNLSYVSSVIQQSCLYASLYSSIKHNLLEQILLKLLIEEFLDLLHWCKANYLSERVIKLDQNQRWSIPTLISKPMV